MEIKCNATKRFLFKINIEDYYNNIKKIGVDIDNTIYQEIIAGIDNSTIDYSGCT